MLFWLISLYPIKETYDSLKNHANHESSISHWCRYWLIYALFMQYDFILSYIPFWGVLNLTILLLSYTPTYTNLFYNGAIATLQYKLVVLNKTFDFQKHLDMLATKYVDPALKVMETSNLPAPVCDILKKMSQIIRAVLIINNERETVSEQKVE